METSDSSRPKLYSFDGFTVDPENFRLIKGDKDVTLTPRAFDVLYLLLDRHDKVVEKQTIFDAIWKNTFVSDHALTKVIKEIRRALSDPARDPKYIETVPKRGYRFIGPLEIFDQVSPIHERPLPYESVGGQSKSSRRPNRRFGIVLTSILALVILITAWSLLRERSYPRPGGPIKTVAVLPFRPLDGQSRNESLEAGMAETLITRLSNAGEIVVRPLSSVTGSDAETVDPAEYGRKIGVDSVIDGSIQKSGERVRITVRMIEAESGTTLWSEQFDEAFTDIFRLQDSIALRVADTLKLKLDLDERAQIAKHYTDDPEAYQDYLNAQLVWHGRRTNWIDQSLALYKAAVAKDPNFSLAYIGMADCYIMLNGHHRISAFEVIDKARPLIDKALTLDGSLAQARNAAAEFKYQYEYDWPGAESEFREAISLNPNVAWIRQAYGWFLMSMGRFDEADSQMELAHELDPSSLTIDVGRGELLYYTRQYDKAIAHFQNMITVEPADSSLFGALQNAYLQAGRFDEAADMYVKQMELNGDSKAKIDHVLMVYKSRGWNGLVPERLESLEDSAEKGNVSAINYANVYARLGEKQKTIFWLTKAVDSHETAVLQMKIDPTFDLVRDDPRFAELLGKIGLQP